MVRYLYCAIPAGVNVDLSGWHGEGAPLEVIAAGGVAGVLGHVAAARYGARALAKAAHDVRGMAPYAIAHQGVVQYVFERVPAVVPLAFGSIHRTRAAAIDALAEQAPRLRPLLRRFAGAQEWGLRVAPDRSDPVIDATARGAGTAYLVARRKKLRSRAPDRAAIRLAERLADRLARESLGRRTTAAANGDLVLRASYLVSAGRVPKLQAALLQSAPELAKAGLVAQLSGPWPAYSFTAPKTGSTGRASRSEAVRGS